MSGLAKFITGLGLGFIAAISIAGGLLMLLVVAAAVGILAASRSKHAFAGAMTAFGATWVVLIGSTYLRCISMGPDCGSSGGELVYIGVGFALLAGGLILTTVLLLESRQVVG